MDCYGRQMKYWKSKCFIYIIELNYISLSPINQSSITDPKNESSIQKNDIGVIKQYVEKEMKKRNDKLGFASSNGNYKTTLNDPRI